MSVLLQGSASGQRPVAAQRSTPRAHTTENESASRPLAPRTPHPARRARHCSCTARLCAGECAAQRVHMRNGEHRPACCVEFKAYNSLYNITLFSSRHITRWVARRLPTVGFLVLTGQGDTALAFYTAVALPLCTSGFDSCERAQPPSVDPPRRARSDNYSPFAHTHLTARSRTRLLPVSLRAQPFSGIVRS